MHYLHIISVQADSSEDAVEAAEEALEPYGDGAVWDWYTVGGRWKGFFNEENTLNFAKDPELFIETLEKVKSQNDLAAREAARDLLNSEDLRQISAGKSNWSEITPYGTLDMALWSFRNAFSQVYNSHSGFYDAVTQTPGNPVETLNRVSLDTGDKEWLVAVDLHN